MARVRAQNAMMRGTLDSLASARSELAVAQADIAHLTRIIEALRALRSPHRAQPPLPAPPPRGSTPGTAASTIRACDHPRDRTNAAATPAGSSADGQRQEKMEAQLAEMTEQLEVKVSRLEAVEAELHIARSQNAEWHRLMALYDQEKATGAIQQQQIEDLQQQVSIPQPLFSPVPASRLLPAFMRLTLRLFLTRSMLACRLLLSVLGTAHHHLSKSCKWPLPPQRSTMHGRNA